MHEGQWKAENQGLFLLGKCPTQNRSQTHN